MKHIFLINPAAGSRGRQAELAGVCRKAALEQNLEYEILVTEHPGHGVELVRKACLQGGGQHLRFYACGGDGTLNEAARGAFGMWNVAVGHFPAGTGNDFIKAFPSYSSQDFLCLENYQDAKLAKSDVLMVDEEASINTVSAGLDVKVAYHVDKFKQLPFAHGVLPYFLGLLVSMAGPISEDLIVVIDGRREAFSDYLFVDLATDNNPQTMSSPATAAVMAAVTVLRPRRVSMTAGLTTR